MTRLKVPKFLVTVGFIYANLLCSIFLSMMARGVEASRAHSSLNASVFGTEAEGLSTTEYVVIDTATTTLLPPAVTEVIVEEFTTETLPPKVQETTENYHNYINRVPDRSKCECGVPRLKPVQIQSSTRVIGGMPAALGEFPWFAAVTKFQHNKLPRWRVVCGAALLNDEWAITASHCLHNRYKDTLEVVFNIRDVHNITSDSSVIRHKIREFFIHPHYDSKTQHDDIALIRLKKPINLHQEKRVTPICLPRKDARNMYGHRNGTFAGYGHQHYGSSDPGPKENSRVLMKVDLPILSHAECLKTKVPSKKNVTENMVCAGTQGKDGCINDSGGPLMVQENGRTVLVGLASWGIGCGLPNYPGVFTRVSQYLTWVQTISGAALCS